MNKNTGAGDVCHAYVYVLFISELSRDRRSSARIYMSLTLHYILAVKAPIYALPTLMLFSYQS